jgi:osmoprotectant transport system permease protein
VGELVSDTMAWFTAPEQWTGPDGIPARTLEHLELSVVAILVAVLLAVPPALALAHRRRGEFLASAVVNTGRAVPSFGIVVLAALLFLTWGVPVRFWSTVVALIALALPPIFTNTYSAIRNVEPATVEAARGMGLTERQLLLGVELPIGAPVILTGVRIAWAQVLATATLGAVISSGGGLGRYIVDGFATGAAGYDQVFAGALLVALLTILGERAFDLTERLVLPVGIKRLLGRAGEAGAPG